MWTTLLVDCLERSLGPTLVKFFPGERLRHMTSCPHGGSTLRRNLRWTLRVMSEIGNRVLLECTSIATSFWSCCVRILCIRIHASHVRPLDAVQRIDWSHRTVQWTKLWFILGKISHLFLSGTAMVNYPILSYPISDANQTCPGNGGCCSFFLAQHQTYSVFQLDNPQAATSP